MMALFSNRNSGKLIIAAGALCLVILFVILTPTSSAVSHLVPDFSDFNNDDAKANTIIHDDPIVKTNTNNDKASLYDATEDSKLASTKQSSSSAKNNANCKDDIKYVIMIDAGSTGSRVHVYKFDVCFSPPKLLDEAFEMLKPGLSSFDTDTQGAAQSLDPLLKLALDTVPKDKQSCTPVAVKATAGLRLLGKEKSDAILAEVRNHLENDYPFPVVANDGISIMEGSDEGVYAWITTNYLLGNIGSSAKNPTAAVFDLGGGSTQIVFEPTEGESMIEGEHKYEISFGGRDFILYQYSHLGYGLMQGRRKINSLLVENALKDESLASKLTPLSDSQLKLKDLSEIESSLTIKNPCLPPGIKAPKVKVELDDKSTYLIDFVSVSKDSQDDLAASQSTQCRFLADTILNKELECESKSCSFNGIYQPSLKHQFSQDNDMFVFSYFYDRLNPIGVPSSFTLQEMKDITKLVCSGSTYWNEFFTQKSHVVELEKEPLWCLDLTFMTSLLHTGYDIPLNRELKTAKKISDNELGWCLGASLPLLDSNSGWKCKIVKDL
ncbi:hypothetical protein B5S33_g2459 [[Candida] boidinii]|nr:hypothetical protein B5S33_g2459 [[Candida] boidinii]